jgi:hypothetical protein
MSKLNPQKATAYVGPGVLRKGGKITPVPNGPLIKKKGPFKGSTLKAGGVIKKAQDGVTAKKTWQQMSAAEKGAKKQELVKKGGMPRFTQYKDSISKDATKRINSEFEKNASNRGMTVDQLRREGKRGDVGLDGLMTGGNGKEGKGKSGSSGKSPCKGGVCTSVNKSRNGSMIKRADGSMSRRGLWDNLRANKGSGKKPTKQMLVQEKKIKAKSKK